MHHGLSRPTPDVPLKPRSGTENLLGFMKTLVDIQIATNKEIYAKANQGAECPAPSSEIAGGTRRSQLVEIADDVS